MMKKIIIILIINTVFSCKEEKTLSENEPQHSEPNKELIVKLGFKTNVQDEFKILFNNIKVDEFQRKNVQIRETVPPSSGFESIVANLGHETNTQSLLMHLGKEEKKVEFNGIEFSYGEKIILVTKSNFNEFLRINKFINIENDGFVFSTKAMDGKHNPIIAARKKLLDTLFK